MFSEAVKNGAQLLDQQKPGWFEEIDLENLDLASHKYCVLGQLFGETSVGLSAIGGRYASTHYGFFAADSRNYPQLTALWAQEIKERRN